MMAALFLVHAVAGCGGDADPPRDDAAAREAWARDLGRVRDEAAPQQKARAEAQERDRTHDAGRLGDGCLAELPAALAATPGGDAVRLIDVLWLERSTERVAAAFEVEHSTSIYSGIVRMLDLALGAQRDATCHLFLVAPDDRGGEVREQLRRPAFRGVADLSVRYIPYGELARHREAIARFGEGLKPIEAIARTLT